MAFKPGKRFRIEESGLREMTQAFQALPVAMKKNSVEAAVRNLGTVSRAAEAIFEANQLRLGQKGEKRFTERPGKVPRQTGNFNFGTARSGTFVGGTFEARKGVFGFGYPDPEIADKATKGIWRVLEFGMSGTNTGAPTARYSALNRFVVTKPHRLPARFEFTSRNPAAAIIQPGSRDRIQEGGGIEGKHFIEDAWANSLEIMLGRYRKALTKATAEFGKK